MPNEFFFLGKLIEIKTVRGTFKFPAGFVLLADGEDGNYLVGIHRGEISSYVHGSPSAKSEKKYFDFNGFSHREVAETEAIDFSEFSDVPFSRALSIVYESNKKHGGGDGQTAQYIHKFGKSVYLWTNETNSVYLLGGGNLVVTERGIVN